MAADLAARDPLTVRRGWVPAQTCRAGPMGVFTAPAAAFALDAALHEW
jgi:hypothetical protein